MCSSASRRLGSSLYGVGSRRLYQEGRYHHCSQTCSRGLSLWNNFIGQTRVNKTSRSLLHCCSVSITTTTKAPKPCYNSNSAGSHFQDSFLKPLASSLRFLSHHNIYNTNINYSNNKTKSFITPHQNYFFSTRATVQEAMSSIHLATGSVCPPLKPGKIRLYSMKYCPYAQRAVLVAEAVGIPYDIVNCNLKDKPEWIFPKNPDGKVPILETYDGKVLYESLVVCDYIDEVYAKTPLRSRDPYQRALDRIFIEKFNSAATSFYKILFAIRDSLPEDKVKENIDRFVESLKPFEEELARRSTTFFGGDRPGMLDFMIWPWFERLPVIKDKLSHLFDYEEAKKENPNLENWRQGMKKDPVIAKILLTPEEHLRFLGTMLDGSPQYDF